MKIFIYLSLLLICGCSTSGGTQTSTHPGTAKTEMEGEKAAQAKEATAGKTMAVYDTGPITSSSKVVFLIKYKLRENPSSKAAIVKSLERGEEAQVIKQQDDWFKVELASGGTGWCHKSAISRTSKQ